MIQSTLSFGSCTAASDDKPMPSTTQHSEKLVQRKSMPKAHRRRFLGADVLDRLAVKRILRCSNWVAGVGRMSEVRCPLRRPFADLICAGCSWSIGT